MAHFAKINCTASNRVASSRRIVVQRRTLIDDGHAFTLQCERIRCGKPTCGRCPHGPYWYVYWSDAGRARSAYIGRKLGGAAEVLAVVDMAQKRADAAKKKPQPNKKGQARVKR